MNKIEEYISVYTKVIFILGSQKIRTIFKIGVEICKLLSVPRLLGYFKDLYLIFNF